MDTSEVREYAFRPGIARCFHHENWNYVKRPRQRCTSEFVKKAICGLIRKIEGILRCVRDETVPEKIPCTGLIRIIEGIKGSSRSFHTSCEIFFHAVCT